MKVPLKRRGEPIWRGGFTHIHWIKSLPFFANPRGVLIHRVESVTTYLHKSGRAHKAVHYLCSAATTADGEFLAEPPANRLVCHACERVAKQKGLPSADRLVGRHVHVGRLRPERMCCCEQAETN
jgi:hypothetical protein